jgi:hypothetical protein
MLPPMNTLDMIKYMHDEVHEKQERSQTRELAAQHSEHRLAGIGRALFRRAQPRCEERCDGELIEPATV